jgi:taurine dioxygenase
MVAKSLEVRPLTDTFGAEVLGVTLSRQMDHDVFAEIKALWLRYEVLLFRGQDIEKEDLIEFSRQVGPLEIHVREEWLNKKHPELLQITNIREDGKPTGALADGEVGWHFDQIYLPKPAVGSVLYSVKIPPVGGSTHFADMTTAYARLPRHLKDVVDGRNAVQSYTAFNQTYSTTVNSKQSTLTPDIAHPLVRTHPYSGRRALYVCPGMTIRISGLPDDESRAVLDELFDWTSREEFVYRHDWRVSDAIMWDNACTMHRRDDFDGEYERLMFRTTILPQADRAIPF